MTLAQSPREKEVEAIIASMRKTTKELCKSKKTAREFLIKHGYITKSGKLTKRYGG
ncbi:MAG: hypothetical protein ABI680_01085 [Chthoniobacteraceae bacterium]